MCVLVCGEGAFLYACSLVRCLIKVQNTYFNYRSLPPVHTCAITRPSAYHFHPLQHHRDTSYPQHTHAHTRTHRYKHAYAQRYAHTHRYAHAHRYKNAHTHTDTHTHTHTDRTYKPHTHTQFIITHFSSNINHFISATLCTRLRCNDTSAQLCSVSHTLSLTATLSAGAHVEPLFC